MTRSFDLATRSQAAACALARLWCDAGTVIALRMWGAGFGLGPQGEDRRMVDEKLPAFADAALVAWHASVLAAWRAPFDPAGAALAASDAWTRSLNRKTRANLRRLSRSALGGPSTRGSRP